MITDARNVALLLRKILFALGSRLLNITDLKIRELNGVMEHTDPFWEERLIRPVDIYPEFRAQGNTCSNSLGDGRYAMRWVFLEIQRSSSIPISGGQHEYTRWGLRPIVEQKAMDILQPDIYWCGGISETLKICAIASTFDIPVIPHGHSSHATAHLIASQPPTTCPIQEFLIKWNTAHQFFLMNPLMPRNGMITFPQDPGLGMIINEDKITAEKG